MNTEALEGEKYRYFQFTLKCIKTNGLMDG